MKFYHHAKRVEDLEYQIQFVAISGTSALLLTLSKHDYARSLLNDIANGDVIAEGILSRILNLLPKVASEKELSYDGSIVTYLYCLSEADLSLAQRASRAILQTSGLFWSRRLARHVIELHRNRQIADSLRAHSEIVQETRFNMSVQRISGDMRSDHPPSHYPVLPDKQYPEWQVDMSTVELEVA